MLLLKATRKFIFIRTVEVVLVVVVAVALTPTTV